MDSFSNLLQQNILERSQLLGEVRRLRERNIVNKLAAVAALDTSTRRTTRAMRQIETSHEEERVREKSDASDLVIDLVSDDEPEEAIDEEELGYEIEMTAEDSDEGETTHHSDEEPVEVYDVPSGSNSASSSGGELDSSPETKVGARYRQMMSFSAGKVQTKKSESAVDNYSLEFVKTESNSETGEEMAEHPGYDVEGEDSAGINYVTHVKMEKDYSFYMPASEVTDPEGISVSPDGKVVFVRGYKFKVPDRAVGVRCNMGVECAGCRKILPCAVKKTGRGADDILYSLDYYKHIFGCREYAQLDIIKPCEECKLLFVTHQSFGRHRSKHVSKPVWMTDVLFHRSLTPKKPDSIACAGCRKVFRSYFYKNNYHEPEFAYYIHCIEDCEAYKKLNLMKKCEECNKIFLSDQAYGPHMARKHPREGEPIRSWMCTSLKQEKRPYTNYNSTISCDGCGEMFPCQMNFGSARPTFIHRMYYIHCIEECSRFRALGTITACSMCKCKFLTKASCSSHKCEAVPPV